ncbi:MAG: Uma2 family endonuclease [bacterium]|nr:Uma2 family endonuclease [bacterium]
MIANPTPPIDVSNGMSLDDFMRLSHEQPFEIVNGRRIDKNKQMSTIFDHFYIIRALFRILDAYLLKTNLGEVFSEATFILPDADNPSWVKGSRLPDLMIFTRERFDAYIANKSDYRTKPLILIPDLIIEVISPNDRFADIDNRLLSDFDNGVKVIWLIDPTEKKAWIYTHDSLTPQRFGADGHLTAPSILPNFTLDLSQIWA